MNHFSLAVLIFTSLCVGVWGNNLQEDDVMHMLLKMAAENAEIKAQYAEIKAEYAVIKAENEEIKAENAGIKGEKDIGENDMFRLKMKI